jgi:hypothetical protein
LPYDRAIVEKLEATLKERLAGAELSQCLAEGAALSDEEAVARATALISSDRGDLEECG